MGPNTLARHRYLAGPLLTAGRVLLGFDGGAGGASGGGSGDAGGTGGTGDQGGSGGAGGAAGGSSGGDSGDGSGGSQGGTGDAGDGDQGGDGDELANLSSAELAGMVRKLRQENGRDRTAAKQAAADEARQQLAQEIGRALGLVKDGEKADPDKLAQQLDEERAGRATASEEARSARVELAIYQNAAQHGADPSALLDSRKFMESVQKLDPAGDGFAGKVEDAIKKAVSDDPARFRTGRAPATGSADHAGGSGEGAKGKATTLAGAIDAHYR